jgi:alkylation response protein AidB-like acyl-CoA dehydrogenase
LNPLLNDAQRQFLDGVQEAVAGHVAVAADDIDATGRIPEGLLGELGAAGALVPDADDDGLLRLALAVEQIARKSGAVASIAGAHGAAATVLGEGFADREALVAGTKAATLVGSADAAIRAEASSDGFRLDGSARLVVNAGADWLVLPAATDAGTAWFAVAAGSEGLSIDEAAETLGLNGNGAADVTLDGVAVGPEARLDVAGADDLLRIVQSALGVGLSRGALDVSIADLQERKAQGDPADRSQAVQWMLADIATDAEAARVTLWQAASQDPGAERTQASAMARLLAAEAAVEATRRAVQIFGDRGALRSAGVERLYRDAKMLEIVGGTNEQQLAQIAEHLLPELTS